METKSESEHTAKPSAHTHSPARGARGAGAKKTKTTIVTKKKRQWANKSNLAEQPDASNTSTNLVSSNVESPASSLPGNTSGIEPTANTATKEQDNKRKENEALRRAVEKNKQAIDHRLDENRIDAEKRVEEIRTEKERQIRLQEERQREQEKQVAKAKEKDSPPASVAIPEQISDAEQIKREDKSKKQALQLEEEKEKLFSAKAAKSPNQQRRKAKFTVAQALMGDDEMEERTRSLAMIKRKREKERLKSREALEQTEKIKREVIVPETITVGVLASRMTERTGDVIKKLFQMGVVASANHEIDADTAELVVAEFGHECKRVADADVESVLDELIDTDTEEKPVPRPPIVTVMGHVDHGKTSLLDVLRQTNVQAGEAGGITQGIRAYQVQVGSVATKTEEKNLVTFIDTPGHEAFTAMRARGANVTDIVILIVAADSGVMPQTVEAINHAKAAEVPIIVAMNKMDLPGADVDKVYSQLLEHNVIPEHLGGDVLCVPISVKTKQGIDDLLTNVLLQAELLECQSPRTGHAKGVVLEARVEKGMGCVTTLLVTSGSVKKGDVFVVGSTWGKVKNIRNDRGDQIKEALPSQPVEILGATNPPLAGDILQTMPKNREAKAQEIANYRSNTEKNKLLSRAGLLDNIDALFDRFKENAEQQTLSIVVKADVQGMVEAIKSNLETITVEEYKIRILHAAVGPVNASDIALASTSNSLIVAFNVKIPNDCEKKARQENIKIIHHDIIHHLMEDIEAQLRRRLEPAVEEVHLGNAEVREIFDMGKHGIIAGCAVVSGKVVSNGRFVIERDQEKIVFEGKLQSLRRFRDEVQSVNSGYECGMTFDNFHDFAVGDVIQCYGIKN